MLLRYLLTTISILYSVVNFYILLSFSDHSSSLPEVTYPIFCCTFECVLDRNKSVIANIYICRAIPLYGFARLSGYRETVEVHSRLYPRNLMFTVPLLLPLLSNTYRFFQEIIDDSIRITFADFHPANAFSTYFSEINF